MARKEAGNEAISVGILKSKINPFVKKFLEFKIDRLNEFSSIFFKM